jgi:IBR domain, a half RING-finger domain
VICTNDVLEAFLPPYITATCSHLPQTCRPCIALWISSRLESSSHDGLTCPQCDQRLDNTSVRAFAAPDVYERYEDLVLRSSLSNNTEFHWCIGPGCRSGQLHADSNPIFRCVHCHLRSCIEHKVPWHEGLTCAAYDASVASRQKEMEVASEKKVKETSRRCPGENCGWRKLLYTSPSHHKYGLVLKIYPERSFCLFPHYCNSR